MEVVPQKSYYGGKEGNGEYVWYRTRVRPYEADLVEISSFSKDFFIVGKNVISPTIEDVDSYLVLRWVPTVMMGTKVHMLSQISTNPVMAEHPIVANVRIKDMGTGTFVGEGLYYGGYEGSSMYSWYRQTTEGTNLLIPGATSINYKATDHDYNCRLVLGYTPVRSDSIVGELVMSEASNIVLPGETITAVEVPPQTEDQQHVWRNYKKEIKYQCLAHIGCDMRILVVAFKNVNAPLLMCSEDQGDCISSDISYFARLVAVYTPIREDGVEENYFCFNWIPLPLALETTMFQHNHVRAGHGFLYAAFTRGLGQFQMIRESPFSHCRVALAEDWGDRAFKRHLKKREVNTIRMASFCEDPH
ncbi:hypothetical protein HPP92_000825 [Vanilla planifolia]|uniref:AIR9-like A9 domain-containing protein n=1 Tax=Vanilla planifolia TaxID=51239 RepID=A0A835VL03_VANPL|nr:hypothetical protein HPP92_000825 [Vanilla planifolia]